MCPVVPGTGGVLEYSEPNEIGQVGPWIFFSISEPVRMKLGTLSAGVMFREDTSMQL